MLVSLASTIGFQLLAVHLPALMCPYRQVGLYTVTRETCPSHRLLCRVFALLLEHLATVLGHAASWFYESLLRRPQKEDSPSPREGNFQERGRSRLRRGPLLRQALRRHGTRR